METTYKKSPIPGGRRGKRNEKYGHERRHLMQLVISLFLFLLVFLGRGVLSEDHVLAWKERLRTDTDFAAALDRLEQSIASDSSGLGSLWKQLNGDSGETRSDNPAREPDPDMAPQPVALLSQTEAHGLVYWASLNRPKDGGTKPEETESVNAVTAIAQAYTDDGVALPKNVSLQYYELGLDQTAIPVNGTVTSGFSYRNSPVTGAREFHLALDIGAAEGTPVGAFADGTVRYIGESEEFGLYFMIDHAHDVSTFYAHCSKLFVRKGDRVTCGQTVALVGQTGKATGPHLHFTLLKDNIRLDPAYYVRLL